MSLNDIKKLQIVQIKKLKKQSITHAFLNKIINPKSHLMAYAPVNFSEPYQALIYSNFKKIIVSPTADNKYLRYQKAGLSKLLHIHWDEFFLKKSDALHAEWSKLSLIEFKKKGGKIIWTVHNEMPQEINSDKERDYFLTNRAFLCERVDLVHVHSDYAKQYLMKKFNLDEQKVVVIPHPSYLGWYNHDFTQRGYREKKTLLVFENSKKYRGYIKNKGFNLIVEAISKISHPDKIEKLHLVGEGAAAIGDGAVKRVQLKRTSGDLKDAQINEFFKASDYAVFGFSSSLTSESLMLALTFGLPPIAPAHPLIKELLPINLHDLLYKPDDADDFARVMDYAVTLSEAEYLHKCEICMDLAIKYSPSAISRRLESEILKRVNV